MRVARKILAVTRSGSAGAKKPRGFLERAEAGRSFLLRNIQMVCAGDCLARWNPLRQANLLAWRAQAKKIRGDVLDA
jgi:hypothetical protein